MTSVQLVEADELEQVMRRLTFNLTNDVTERGLLSSVECQRLIHDHLKVSHQYHHVSDFHISVFNRLTPNVAIWIQL